MFEFINKSPFSTQIVSEIWGYGFRTGNEKWDDGGKTSGDGWYLNWDLETGRNWFGLNLISKDICLKNYEETASGLTSIARIETTEIR